MTLIVEDGTGLSTAESYVSVAAADIYVPLHYATVPSSWSGANTSRKEIALRQAAQAMEARYRGRWIGSKVKETQALSWPRSGALDEDGFEIEDDALPQALKDAQVELALKEVAGDTLVADQTSPGTIESESVKVGPIEEAISYSGGKSQAKQYTLADMLLRPLVTGVGLGRA